MANAPLKKIIAFYCRFTPNYSKIGFHFRKLAWRRLKGDYSGQVWLVTGGRKALVARRPRLRWPAAPR